MNDLNRKAEMVRTLVYLLVALAVLGTIATPGLGAFALVATPFLVLGFLWRTALTVSTRGRSIDAVVHIRPGHLLGPGGPDDSFAASPPDENEYPMDVPAGAPVHAGNGRLRGVNVLRPSLAQTPSVQATAESSNGGGR